LFNVYRITDLFDICLGHLKLRIFAFFCTINEHNEAFYYWHKAKQEKFIKYPLDLFHIDAHSDMGKAETFQDSLYPSSTHPGDFLKYYKNFGQNELHNGNFIIPAVLLGLVKNVYFIYPKWRNFTPRRKRCNVASVFGEGKKIKYDMMVQMDMEAKMLKGLPDFKNYTFSMGEIDRIPKNRKVILDIDLDYFACRDSILNHLGYELEITEDQFHRQEEFLGDRTLPFAGLEFSFLQRDGRFFTRIAHKKSKEIVYLPSREEISAEIDTLVTTLQARQTRPAVVTIARSNISGYCPQDYTDFIETELTQRLKTWLGPLMVS
jgi:hypothetical protein